jgi:uncharacterized MAPEG superfamily protein
MSFNIPLLSIPVYYVLAVYPHGHAIFAASKGNLKKHDNTNPKSTKQLDSLKRRLTAREFAAYERAERCHSNHLENMPLFCATIFAGLLAEQKVGTGDLALNEFAVGFILLRVLYTVCYILTETIRLSYMRSALYFLTTGWAFYVIGRAAYLIGA